MKKQDIVDLIKYHVDKNDNAFRKKSMDIADEFRQMGDISLGNYVDSLVTTQDVLVPQEIEYSFSFLRNVPNSQKHSFPLPESIFDDINGIINAINRHIGINKFLFVGKPGTGKTETVKVIASLLHRELLKVDFDSIIDSKLGSTQKNIHTLFKEINSIPYPDQVIVLMDEIDSIAYERTANNDVREMGRATSSVLKELDEMNNRVVLIATTNLYKYMDKALKRRFSLVINFNRYDTNDLHDVADAIINDLYKQPDFQIKRDLRLFNKIISLYGEKIPLPGDLKNIITTSVAFSTPNDSYDYLRRLYKEVTGEKPSIEILKKQGFTVREIGTLLNSSKSTVARKLNGDNE